MHASSGDRSLLFVNVDMLLWSLQLATCIVNCVWICLLFSSLIVPPGWVSQLLREWILIDRHSVCHTEYILFGLTKQASAWNWTFHGCYLWSAVACFFFPWSLINPPFIFWKEETKRHKSANHYRQKRKAPTLCWIRSKKIKTPCWIKSFLPSPVQCFRIRMHWWKSRNYDDYSRKAMAWVNIPKIRMHWSRVNIPKIINPTSGQVELADKSCPFVKLWCDVGYILTNYIHAAVRSFAKLLSMFCKFGNIM